MSLKWKPEAALTVVMAAKGYPGSYSKGSVIRGLDKVATAKVRACVLCACAWGSGGGGYNKGLVIRGLDKVATAKVRVG